jgi:hypothetical protein
VFREVCDALVFGLVYPRAVRVVNVELVETREGLQRPAARMRPTGPERRVVVLAHSLGDFALRRTIRARACQPDVHDYLVREPEARQAPVELLASRTDSVKREFRPNSQELFDRSLRDRRYRARSGQAVEFIRERYDVDSGRRYQAISRRGRRNAPLHDAGR